MSDKVSIDKSDLQTIRERLWNDWTNMPGKDNGVAVFYIDRALGDKSVWADRYLDQKSRYGDSVVGDATALREALKPRPGR